MSIIKRISKGLVYFIITMIIILLVYSFFVLNILKKDYVNFFGYTFFITESGSMHGTIEVNDFIVVKVDSKYKVNDIITYKNSDGLTITHRVVSIDGDNVITKGDVNPEKDDPISKKRVIGKVVNIINPTALIQLVCFVIIIFILLILFSFKKLVKKMSDTEDRLLEERDVLPEDIFSSPKDRKDPTSLGLTVNIPLEEIENIKKIVDKEEIEILGEEEILDLDEDKLITVNMNQEEKEEEFLDLMNSLLKIKNSSIDTSKINKKWLNKYQYVYKLCNVLEYKDTYSLVELIEHPSFREIYDYDLDKIGLYENVRNLLYEMPIYVFAKVLFMAVLYNDDAIFDAIFKIMKYKVLIDKNNNFRVVDNNYSLKQIKSLITFIEKVSKKYDNNNVFELDKIKRLVKIKNYINE